VTATGAASASRALSADAGTVLCRAASRARPRPPATEAERPCSHGATCKRLRNGVRSEFLVRASVYRTKIAANRHDRNWGPTPFRLTGRDNDVAQMRIGGALAIDARVRPLPESNRDGCTCAHGCVEPQPQPIRRTATISDSAAVAVMDTTNGDGRACGYDERMRRTDATNAYRRGCDQMP
jgi:hypothetical protein